MNPKILLVDDNADLLLVTQIILKGQGYEPVLATSLAEAERKIRIHRPSLLLLDIGLGGFLGGVGVVAGIGVARVRLGGVFGVALGLADAVVLVACFAVGNR